MKTSLKIVKRMMSDYLPQDPEAFFADVNRALSFCKGKEKLPSYDRESFWIAELQWTFAETIAEQTAMHGDFKIKNYLKRLRERTADTISPATDLYYEWTIDPDTGYWE